MEKNSNDKMHSKWTRLSWVSGGISGTIMGEFVSIRLFFFYEMVVLLPVIFIGVASTFITIFDLINDPYFGYFIDKPRRFTKRWGRRFPWIMIGGIPFMVTILFLFSPPSGNPQINPWPVFFWLLTIYIIREFTSELGVGTRSALYPEKFRSNEERRKLGFMGNYGTTIGVVLGLILPSILIGPIFPLLERSSYLIVALFLFVPMIIFWILGIPGIREDNEMIDRAIQQWELEPRYKFFKEVKLALKNRNFLIFILMGIARTYQNISLNTSLFYWLFSVIKLPVDGIYQAFIVLAMYLSIVVTSPIWLRIMKKLGHKKTLILSNLLAIGLGLVVFFIRSLIGAIFIAAIYGFTHAGYIMIPIYGDVVDDLIVGSEKRKEGLYSGLLELTVKLGLTFTPMIITFIHIYTNFVPGSIVQTASAQQGILWGMAGIPAIMVLIATLILWKFYNLTPDKTKANRERLEELNL
ncbi:MAG: MFS transporter [Promethearchaeota archaeon]|jgi:GPH family glycoside/pentoside/hexuronide:cation symporter